MIGRCRTPTSPRRRHSNARVRARTERGPRGRGSERGKAKGTRTMWTTTAARTRTTGAMPKGGKQFLKHGQPCHLVTATEGIGVRCGGQGPRLPASTMFHGSAGNVSSAPGASSAPTTRDHSASPRSPPGLAEAWRGAPAHQRMAEGGSRRSTALGGGDLEQRLPLRAHLREGILAEARERAARLLQEDHVRNAWMGRVGGCAALAVANARGLKRRSGSRATILAAGATCPP